MRKLLFLFISICCYAQAALSNENVFSLSSYIFETGTIETVYVQMDQSEGYGGFQFNLYLPEGVSIVMDGNNRPKIYEDGPWGGSDVTLACTEQKDGSYIFILYPNIGAEMPKIGNGFIFEMMVETSIDAKTGPAKVQFKNTRFASLDDVTIKLDNVEYDAEVISTCSVTASTDDDTKGSVVIVGGGDKAAIGSTVTVTATPMAGYEFVNWTYEDKEISSENPYQFTATQNIALVANFKAKVYDVKFVLGNGEDDVVEALEFGAVINAPENPTKTGHTFGGWDPTFAEGATVPVDGITYTAIWSVNQYTITFDTDGGSEIASITQDYDSEVTAPAKPTKTGCTFKGWDKELPAKMPAEDITVKALWSVNQYKLTYMVDDTEYKTMDVDYGSVIKAESDPEKEGYTFSGWTGMPESMPDHDVTVTGSFTVNSYILTIYLNGELYSTEDVEYGAALNIENPAVPEGNVFDGWSETLPETMPAHNVNLYATYSKDPSSGVDFNLDSDSVVTVYTLFGTLVYKDRKWSEVADTLANGIYIVSGKKVIIK